MEVFLNKKLHPKIDQLISSVKNTQNVNKLCGFWWREKEEEKMPAKGGEIKKEYFCLFLPDPNFPQYLMVHP